MKKDNMEERIYSINIQDIQDVAGEVLDRPLTKKETALVKESVGDYIDWFQAIEFAINKHIAE